MLERVPEAELRTVQATSDRHWTWCAGKPAPGT
jgi:hypothetical protein